MAEGSSEISIESESENLKKINETELPNDFEPGLSSDSMLLPSGSFDEEDHLSVSDTYDDRRLSNISKIEKSVRETTDEYIPPEEPDMEQKFLGKEEVVGGEGAGDQAVPEEMPPIVTLVLKDEEVHSEEWRQHSNHFFILSEAGKPIYSRYGEEDKLVTLMGVIQALVSVVQGSGDLLRGFSTADKFVGFLVRPPLVLAGVSSMPLNQIHAQLGYLHSQILAMLTLTRLRGIFEKRRNYDLRRLLGTDSARLLNCLVDSMQEDPAFLLGAVRCLPLDGAVRDAVGQAIVHGCSKEKQVVFAILVADKQLVSLVRMKQYSLYPADLHILVNFVASSESFKAAESWAPICLPKFDSSGYLYAYISYLDVDHNVFLVLLTSIRDHFFPLQKCRHRILEKLEKNSHLTAINKAVQAHGFSVEETAVPELRHFLYKSRSTAQYTGPCAEAPYLAPEDWLRLFSQYQYLHHRMFTLTRPLKTLFYTGHNEALMGWHTTGFELYAVFDPLVTKLAATTAMWHIVHWIKKEEDRLFIMKPPTF